MFCHFWEIYCVSRTRFRWLFPMINMCMIKKSWVDLFYGFSIKFSIHVICTQIIWNNFPKITIAQGIFLIFCSEFSNFCTKHNFNHLNSWKIGWRNFTILKLINTYLCRFTKIQNETIQYKSKLSYKCPNFVPPNY